MNMCLFAPPCFLQIVDIVVPRTKGPFCCQGLGFEFDGCDEAAEVKTSGLTGSKKEKEGSG
jgi:hypothetical protein